MWLRRSLVIWWQGRVVKIEKMDTDRRYGRTIGMVFIDSKNVNEELLRAGLAWHYKYYDKNKEWAKLAEEARVGKRGLWSIPNPVPPWEWRRRK
ncbi:MAG TPA: thermonuclease family protein [Cyclobacteriaceae bacterium]